MITVDRVRGLALSLPGVSAEPHFDMTSFRVLGKIFATVAADEARLHVFMDEDEARACAAEDPVAFEPLRWGRRIRGVRVLLTTAPPDRVLELVEESWRRKAPRRLVARLDADRQRPAGA
jgi:hypothetical protein